MKLSVIALLCTFNIYSVFVDLSADPKRRGQSIWIDNDKDSAQENVNVSIIELQRLRNNFFILKAQQDKLRLGSYDSTNACRLKEIQRSIARNEKQILGAWRLGCLPKRTFFSEQNKIINSVLFPEEDK
jgi:hypothetical protein